MKKVLLFATVALSAVAASAQKVVPVKNYTPVAANKCIQAPQRVQRPAMQVLTKALAVNADTKAIVGGARKTKATGLYYTKPAGTLFTGWGIDGSGYGPEIVVMPTMAEYVFENQSTNPADTKWAMNGTQLVDLTEYADADHNMPWSCPPGAMYYPLILSNSAGTDSYILGETSNEYYIQKQANVPSLIAAFPFSNSDGSYNFGPQYIGYLNDHSNVMYGFGGMDKHAANPDRGYLYGSGTVTFNDTKASYPMAGVLQEYEKPASPLYVEDFYCQIVSLEPNHTPIAEGKVVNAYILNAETGEEIAALTATKDDVYGVEESGSMTFAMLKFTQYTEGIFGGEPVATPFVIDCPFVVQITGFSQEGVDFGFMGGKNGGDDPEACEDKLADTFAVLYDAEAENDQDKYKYYTLYSNDGENGVSIDIKFNALFDKVQVVQFGTLASGETVRVNDVCVNNEGDACYNKADETLSGVLVYTTFPWFDTDDNEYYTMEGLPEWVVTAEVDGSAWEEQDGLNLVGFTAEPLPTGVEGRGALVYVEGRGYTASCPIFVYQGSYEAALKDLPEGIRETIANKSSDSNTIYDLAGRRALRNTRGVVVANGQKILK